MALDFPNSPTIGQVFPFPAISGAGQWQWDGNEWLATTALLTSVSYVGLIELWSTTTVQPGRLKANGATYNRTSYPDLVNYLIQTATLTFTNGSTNITWPNHGRSLNDPIKLFTTGTLPTGFTAGTHGLVTVGTVYYIQSIVNASTITLSATPGGSAISASSAGSGVQTGVFAPHGDGDGATTFTVPDLRAQFPRAWDDGKGTDANRSIGSAQLDQFQGHFQNDTATDSGHAHGVVTGNAGAFGGSVFAQPPGGPSSQSGNIGTWNTNTGNASITINKGSPITDGVNGTPRTGAETRPINVALMATIMYATAANLQAVTPVAPAKNYVINGAMMISQQFPLTGITVSGNYPVDQFALAIATTTGVVSVAQVASTSLAGSPNRLRATVTTADASMTTNKIVCISQKIEGLRVADLMSGTATPRQVTIRFGCKGPAGTYCVAIQNNAANRSYVAEYIIAAGEANTDVIKSVTLTLDNTGTWIMDNSGAGLVVLFALMGGPTYQTPAGAWVGSGAVCSSNQFNFLGTNGNIFELFDVGLYLGAAAPSFVVPDYASELQECMRYFQIFGGSTAGFIGVGGNISATAAAVIKALPVPMRAGSQTVTYANSFSDWYVRDLGNNTNHAVTGDLGSNATPFDVCFNAQTASGLSTGSAASLIPATTNGKLWITSRM